MFVGPKGLVCKFVEFVRLSSFVHPSVRYFGVAPDDAAAPPLLAGGGAALTPTLLNLGNIEIQKNRNTEEQKYRNKYIPIIYQTKEQKY